MITIITAVLNRRVLTLQYTQEQKDSMKKSWARKIEIKKLEEQKMRAEAIEKAKKIASFLKTNYDVGYIYRGCYLIDESA